MIGRREEKKTTFTRMKKREEYLKTKKGSKRKAR